ncbi:MAG: universal stress protein [Solirubrobacteraceae bacterium]
MIVLAYDASQDACRAIATAGALIGGGGAVVVYVSSPEPVGLAPAGVASFVPVAPTIEEQNRELDEGAQRVVDEGSRLAHEAGFEPTTQVLRGSGVHGIQEAILAAADEHHATLIVVGRGGAGALKSMLLGSVAEALVKHATRPVLVVPEPAG